MALVRLLPHLEQDPLQGSFYCRPCDLADTTVVAPAGAVQAIAVGAEDIASLT